MSYEILIIDLIVASFGCAACLLIVSLVDNGLLILFFLSMGLALTSAYVPGYNTSIVSIAPSFTAFISSYAQGYAQIASILAPLTISLLTAQVNKKISSQILKI